MKVKTDIQNNIETHWDYAPPYKVIADTMREQGKYELGVAGIHQVLTNGAERPFTVDLTRVDRALRTLTIIKLSADGLARLHEYELKHCDYLLVGEQIRVVIKEDYRTSGPLSETQLDYIYKFQDRLRPECEKFMGISIPPYFPLDMQFDGMIYHIKWDDLIHAQAADFDLPDRVKSRRSVSNAMLDNEH